jgi:hypothetical protein
MGAVGPGTRLRGIARPHLGGRDRTLGRSFHSLGNAVRFSSERVTAGPGTRFRYQVAANGLAKR